MGNTFYFNWEVSLIQWIQSILGKGGTTFMSLISAFDEDLLMTAVLGSVYWCIDKRAGKKVGMALVMHLVWFPTIKNIAMRRRPYWDIQEIQCLKPVDPSADIYDAAKQGYSFPSGHSGSAASVYGSIARFFKKNWLTAVCIVLTVLVGISRFSLGVHYPTDVLCGWALGAAAMLIVPWLEERIEKRSVFCALLLLTALPGVFICRTTDYYSGLGLLIGFMAAIPFEEKYVKFENTRRPLAVIMRIFVGFVIYFALNFLMKLPFSEAFLASESAACFAYRVFRYAVLIFVEAGIYPMLFRMKVMK